MTRWMMAAVLALPTLGASAEETLLMLERPGCVWCARWREEIGPAYAKTPEGARAPLRVVDVTEPWPDDLPDLPRDFVTPTFVLLREGAEVGRIRGYPGDEFFWVLLGNLLDDPTPAPR